MPTLCMRPVLCIPKELHLAASCSLGSDDRCSYCHSLYVTGRALPVLRGSIPYQQHSALVFEYSVQSDLA